ncbi:MAG: alkaline phosphatase family protein [Saprospiraceae bacterium]|nr:alkaline phosphatase family protein [Saprospiraceae bacterium]
MQFIYLRMKNYFVLTLLYFIIVNAQVDGQTRTTIHRIAFGSCANQDERQPILDIVTRYSPDMFIYLGDNIYGDTEDMEVLKEKYNKLGSKPEYQRLKAATKIFATWDDHDYGINDGGRHFSKKEESKKIFLDFFGDSEHSNRRSYPGVYNAYAYGGPGQRVQLILLDTRTFRDNLVPFNKDPEVQKKFFYPLEYSPQVSKDSTLLGEAQWEWLERQLKEPADVRIIASSIQFGASYNGYESWANFPNELKRFFDILNKTQANGVVFISGDVHYSEISLVKKEGVYPIYDFTSSGITSTWDFATPNKNRIEGPVMENNFGLLTFDWDPKNPTLKMECIDNRNNQRFEYTIPIRYLIFGRE